MIFILKLKQENNQGMVKIAYISNLDSPKADFIKEIMEKAHEEHKKTIKSRNVQSVLNTFNTSRRNRKILKPTTARMCRNRVSELIKSYCFILKYSHFSRKLI